MGIWDLFRGTSKAAAKVFEAWPDPPDNAQMLAVT
jgi:hypothetical protein